LNLKKITFVSVALSLFGFGFVHNASAQDRDRVVKSVLSQPVNRPLPQAPDKTSSTVSSRPVNAPVQRPPLTTDITVRPEYRQQPQLVKKTGDSNPLAVAAARVTARSRYNPMATSRMLTSIQSKLGIPYLYGSNGPNRYDCSGFVWAVFSDAGMGFTRQSARSLWSASVPVEGDERFQFGTLVFMNKLGHMGIVADANGFYHASSSKGITYSPFKGYWENRIVGFRRLIPGAVPAELEEAEIKN
jgi:cell wall-associated NlpC family hydrolase